MLNVLNIPLLTELEEGFSEGEYYKYFIPDGTKSEVGHVAPSSIRSGILIVTRHLKIFS